MKIISMLHSKDKWTPGLITIIYGWNQPEYKFLLKVRVYSLFKHKEVIKNSIIQTEHDGWNCLVGLFVVAPSGITTGVRKIFTTI